MTRVLLMGGGDLAKEVGQTIPRCSVTSLADIFAPVLAAQCLDADIVAVRRTDSRWVGHDASLDEVPLPEFRSRRVRALGRSGSRRRSWRRCC